MFENAYIVQDITLDDPRTGVIPGEVPELAKRERNIHAPIPNLIRQHIRLLTQRGVLEKGRQSA